MGYREIWNCRKNMYKKFNGSVMQVMLSAIDKDCEVDITQIKITKITFSHLCAVNRIFFKLNFELLILLNTNITFFIRHIVGD